MSANCRELITGVEATAAGDTVVHAEGTLDTASYLRFRDTIIKAADDEPRAVIVDVDGLAVPQAPAWGVLASAHWLIRHWQGLPVVAVRADADTRHILDDMHVTRYVPVYPTVAEAVGAVATQSLRPRQRARLTLDHDAKSVRRAQSFVDKHMSLWAMCDRASVAVSVTTFLVENAIAHTTGECTLRFEAEDGVVTVAVSDCSTVPAARRETNGAKATLGGLDLLAALCRSWGSSPTPSGKTVWAVIGPENGVLTPR